jgi:hypothetical protein
MPGQIHNGAEDAGRPPRVFVSAHRADKQWARWLHWQLADAGCEVVLQDWGFLPEEDFSARAQAVGSSQLVLVVLSQDYIDNPLAAADWTEALVAQVGDDRLLPVMAAPCTPPAALRGQALRLRGREELDAIEGLRDVLARRGLTSSQPHPRIGDLRRPRYPALRSMRDAMRSSPGTGCCSTNCPTRSRNQAASYCAG